MSAQHRYESKVPESDAVVCNQTCEFVHGLVANFSGEDAWIWMLDTCTKNGTKPDGVPLRIANNDSRSIDQEVLNKRFSTGLYVLASRTPYAKDIIPSAAADSVLLTPATGFLFEFAVRV